MIKRFFCILLCLGLGLNSIMYTLMYTFSFAAEDVNIQEDKTSKEMFLLSYLGIIEVTEDESKVKTVTRGDFSEYICKAFKIGEVTDKV